MIKPMTALGQIPLVCFAREVAAIFRLSHREVTLSEKHSPWFPTLPMLDRRYRYSGEVLKWILSQTGYESEFRRYREVLERSQRVRRKRNAWYEYGPPHTTPFIGAAQPGELPTESLETVATTLRLSVTRLRELARQDLFALPPVDRWPLRWTPQQLTRFLAPPDVKQLERMWPNRSSFRNMKTK